MQRYAINLSLAYPLFSVSKLEFYKLAGQCGRRGRARRDEGSSRKSSVITLILIFLSLFSDLIESVKCGRILVSKYIAQWWICTIYLIKLTYCCIIISYAYALFGKSYWHDFKLIYFGLWVLCCSVMGFGFLNQPSWNGLMLIGLTTLIQTKIHDLHHYSLSISSYRVISNTVYILLTPYRWF